MYSIGPQIINIRDLDFTYKRFKEKAEIIKHNEKIFNENQRYKTELLREKKVWKYILKKMYFQKLKLLLKS